VPQQTVFANTLEPRESLVTIANVIYGLHAIGIVIGLVGASTIVGAFLFSIPSIIAVVLNYIWRNDTKATYLESHFRWQIRTFWFGWLWIAIGFICLVTIILSPIALAIFVGITAWVVYRVAKGWLRLRDKRPMYS
jgi:uncharacterized membrane protein